LIRDSIQFNYNIKL